MIKGQDIICVSTSDWQKPWGSKQQLMLRLSASNRVLYIEYQASFLHLFSLPFLFLRIKKIKNNLNKVNGNLFVFTLYPYLPFGYYSRTLNKINQYIILLQFRRILRIINFVNPILWLYPPCAVDLIGKLNEKLVVYHCIADFSNEKKNRLRNRTISLMEKELAQKSDLVLTLTDLLYKKFKTMIDNTYLFQSAVDDKLFSSLVNSKVYQPPDIASLKRPRVGVIGYLDGKVLDIDLLCYIADAQPGWSLVLIGPKFRHVNKFKNLIKRKNIHFLGEKQHDEVPHYIKNLDVCIIPYHRNEFTNNVSPLKLYEYMAMGKPVVSTNFSNLEDFKESIRTSDTKEGFVKEIALSLREDNEELVHRRLNIAKENSWEKRLQFISQLMEKNLNRN